MQHRTDHGTIRLRLLAETPCVARVAWYAEGRLVGQRRLWHRETDLVLPEGRWTLEVSDERSAHDPSRLAPTRLEVLVRAGWRTATDVVLTRGAVLTGFVADAAPRLARFATVTATTADGRSFSVRTDGLGGYTLAGLPATACLVRATKGTQRTAPVVVETVGGEQHELDLVLTETSASGSRSATADLLVGAAFTGVVLDEHTGAAAYAAIVEVRDSRGVLLGRTRTDHRGCFVVGGDLPASSGLTVVVKSGPDRIEVDQRRLHGLACREAQLVDLGQVTLPRSPHPARPARASLPRASAAAMSLPATRV